jgi:2-keto-3-deoxy-L-rhamnonate aldolase RhmA
MVLCRTTGTKPLSHIKRVISVGGATVLLPYFETKETATVALVPFRHPSQKISYKFRAVFWSCRSRRLTHNGHKMKKQVSLFGGS